jgi:hypothetical protein
MPYVSLQLDGPFLVRLMAHPTVSHHFLMRYARARYLLSCLARFRSLYPHLRGGVSCILGRPTGSPFKVW